MFPAFQNPVAMVYVEIHPDFPTYHNYMGYCAAYLAICQPSGRRELFRLSGIIM